MKTTTDNGFTVELVGHGYGSRALYIYSPVGICVFNKQYEWWQVELAKAEFDALVALSNMRVVGTVAA